MGSTILLGLWYSLFSEFIFSCLLLAVGRLVCSAVGAAVYSDAPEFTSVCVVFVSCWWWHPQQNAWTDVAWPAIVQKIPSAPAFRVVSMACPMHRRHKTSFHFGTSRDQHLSRFVVLEEQAHLKWSLACKERDKQRLLFKTTSSEIWKPHQQKFGRTCIGPWHKKYSSPSKTWQIWTQSSPD